MDEEQVQEIITKLDYLYLNSMTKDQADNIIEKLKGIESELADLSAILQSP